MMSESRGREGVPGYSDLVKKGQYINKIRTKGRGFKNAPNIRTSFMDVPLRV